MYFYIFMFLNNYYKFVNENLNQLSYFKNRLNYQMKWNVSKN